MRNVIAIYFCLSATVGLAQIGGKRSFDFLQLPVHARLAALGGVNVSLADRDINFFHNNPALTGDTLNGLASASYQFYVGGVGNAMFTYAHDSPKLGQVIAGIQHIRYGTITGYDPAGVETLDYTAGETAILIGRTHRLGNFRFGASLKGVFSNIAGYRASALLLDVGGIFKHPDKDFIAGLAMKNMGIVLRDYRENNFTNLPFDVQAGVTFKPEHMPIRFSFTGYNLGRSGLLYEYAFSEKPSALKRFFSHVNAGAEILFHRNVNLLVGYNYLLHQALRWESGASVGGVCYGFSLFVKPVEFIFGRSAYSVGNAGYSFTLSTNTNQFLKRRKF